MYRYVARRLIIAIPVVFGILLLSFIFVQLLPGDPARAMLDPKLAVSPEYVLRRRAELGLDEPILVQFVAWLRELFQGNLGYSFHSRLPVAEMIGARMWATVQLTLAAVLIALGIGVFAGVIAALKQNSRFDYIASAVSMSAVSIPDFFLGLTAIYVFAIWLGVLPTGGMQTLGTAGGGLVDSLRHLVLPACVLAAALAGSFVRYTRQGMLDVLRQDYITTARAMGVSKVRVVVRYGLRNALIPLITVLGVLIPTLLGGAVIIETVFAWPGVGSLAYKAVIGRDYPIVIAFVLISSLLVMLFNLLADLLAAVLDPRIRL